MQILSSFYSTFVLGALFQTFKAFRARIPFVGRECSKMAKSAVLAFVAAACAFGSADAFGVNSAAVQLRGSSFASAASAARPAQVPFCLAPARSVPWGAG